MSGWKLVPVEPTEEMLKEIHLVESFTGRAIAARYAALLAAAPQPPAGGEPEVVATCVVTVAGCCTDIDVEWSGGALERPEGKYPLIDRAHFTALQARLQAAEAERDELRKDAERWRFFSSIANELQAFPHAWGLMTPEKMNFMCDEAMSQQVKP